jgi:UDP-N-acetylmuramate dehydrogenase
MTMLADVALADWCTLGVGGPARWFCHAGTEDDILAALAWARGRNLAVHILGGGSNVVIADEGFDGLVIHVDIRGVRRAAAHGREIFSAGAGEPWDGFVASTVDAACAGLECLSGIPGLVGGTPVQNVGAYGQEVSGSIVRVQAIDRQALMPVTLSASECGFGYRTSRFRHHDRFIVARVEFALAPGGPPTLAYADVITLFQQEGIQSPSLPEVRDAILQIRRRKGMVIEPGNPANRSVGSFFVNPIVSGQQFDRLAAALDADTSEVPHYAVGAASVKVPAAWLIERAGFHKGLTRGVVGVSPFQAQAIVNLGGARASDVVTLAADIKRAVWESFGIAVVPEPVFVGFRPTRDLQWLLDPRPRTA